MAPSFEEYAAARLPALLRLAGALCGNTQTAEDVVQEVLLRASARWDHIGATRAPDAYVRRMVINEYQSWRRKWARLIPYADVADRAEPDHAVRQADYDEMAQRLARLPPKQRTVIVLRYYEGLTDPDIAALLGCSPATVRSHAARALKRLHIEVVRTQGDDATSDAALTSTIQKDI